MWMQCFTKFCRCRFQHSKIGALIQGQWYVHVLSLLNNTYIGTYTYYVQPLQVPRYVHVPASKYPL